MRVASAALGLVGTPFILHGRDPMHGLDCVGLVYIALRRAGLKAKAPSSYRLRNSAIDHTFDVLAQCDLIQGRKPVLVGDILLVSPAPAQHHLIIAGAGATYIHAHAGLRCVVSMPGQPQWPIERLWRPQSKD